MSTQLNLGIPTQPNSTDSAFVSDVNGIYSVNSYLTEDDIVNEALKILAVRNKPGVSITSPGSVKEYIQLKIAELEFEIFGGIFLDSKHRIINDRILFRGTIDTASVPIREVVKDALACNAAAMIVYHNHPSGNPEPSAADKSLTKELHGGLGIVGVKLLDHLVCGTEEVVSLAELGSMY